MPTLHLYKPDGDVRYYVDRSSRFESHNTNFDPIPAARKRPALRVKLNGFFSSFVILIIINKNIREL